MKVAAVIAEFNPFTKGHEYIIKRAKETTGADYVIVVMSGNFVQRGEPAVCDKYLRTKMALECGADLIIELPVVYSAASAEYFAKGAVSLLDRLGMVDFLCFGAENDDLNVLSDIAEILLAEPDDYRDSLKELLKGGISYPAARAAALCRYVLTENGSGTSLYPDAINETLASANNILAIEYLKALKVFKSIIVPVAVKRIGAGYNDLAIAESSDGFSGASAVRKAITDNNLLGIAKSVPLNCNEIIDENRGKKLPVTADDFSLILASKLLEVKSPEELEQFLDVKSDLANKIFKNLSTFTTFTGFAEALKTKNNTLTSINRALLHIMLGIKKEQTDKLAKTGYHEYVRILGFKKDATKELMGAIKFGCNLPLVTKMADFEGSELMDLNVAADAYYSLIVRNKFANTKIKNEFNSGLTMI